MEFGVLGPVVVRHDGQTLTVGSGRERFVLATLLLNAGRLTTVDRLLDALWPDPPNTARAQLHNMISNVRRRLRPSGGDLIVTRPEGYVLHLREHHLDLLQFRDLTERGRLAGAAGNHDRAADLFADALALWRGPALSDVTDDLASTTRQLLHEERVAAAEARIDAQLALGRFDDVLRDLDMLLIDHPYRERLHEIRMAALADTGRRAEALAAYRQLYRHFADDLGVEPGPALRDLEQRILRGEPAAQAPLAGTPRQLPTATPALTGRDELIDEICAELGTDDDSAAQVRVLVGPGGVGKSSVALAVAQRLDKTFPDGQLYADLRGTHDAPADPHAVLGRLLRTLAAGPSVPDQALPDDLDERVAMYRSALAGRRVLIVLDDAAAEEQVRPLLPGSASCRVLVTSRRRLGALLGATRWSVPVLAPDAAVTLLGTVIGTQRVAAAPEAASAVVELCGRLPLAVRVAAARLAVHPEWTLEDFRSRLADQWGRLDELAVGDLDVRASIELSYQVLDDRLRMLLRRIGLSLADDWPTWVAQELIGEESFSRVERMLDRLAEVHLIEPLGRDAVGQSRYRLHGLIRDFAAERAAEEDDEDERAEAVSRVLSSWLALATEADQRADHHNTLYPAGLDAVAAPQVAVRATRDQPRAWLEVERHSLATALEQAGAQGHPELAGLLALRMSGFLALRAYDDERRHALDSAAAVLRETGPDDLLLKILQAQFAVYAQRAQCAEMPALAAEALALARKLGDDTSTARALLHAGLAARRLGRLREAAEMLDGAIASANDGANPDLPGSLLPSLLINRAEVHRDLGEPELAIPVIEQALTLRRKVGNQRLTAMNLIIYAYALIDHGRLSDAERALAEAQELTEDIGDTLHATYVTQTLADVDIRRGRWRRAASRLDRALPEFEAVSNDDGIAEVYRTRGELAVAMGDPAAAVDPLRAALAIWRQLSAPLEAARLLARLAHAHDAAGQPEAAATCRTEYQAILADLELSEDCLRLPPR